MTIRRTGVLRPTDRDVQRTIFAYTTPSGRLFAVIDAENVDYAWIVATGWGDKADIAQRKKQGWRMTPCMVEWDE